MYAKVFVIYVYVMTIDIHVQLNHILMYSSLISVLSNTTDELINHSHNTTITCNNVDGGFDVLNIS